MKQIQFQHYRKAPHPFQQYGNIPPIALKNRSPQQHFAALPQGEEAFVHKIGKKIFNKKHQSSIKQHWLGIQDEDSLSHQLSKQHQKIRGKSLQTSDIEGAQGGSLKPSAVKYKQKATLMKYKGNFSLDRYDRQKQDYRYSIQKAIKSQHQNDKQIGKMISNKGKGHHLNPELNQNMINNYRKRKSQENISNEQNFLKQKYQSFESKDQKYMQFFNEQRKKQDNYQKFFSRLQKKEDHNKTLDQKSLEIKSLKSGKYQTIDQLNHKERQQKDIRKQYELWRRKQLLKNYQPPNFSKRSIQSQFKNQHNQNNLSYISPIHNEPKQQIYPQSGSSEKSSHKKQFFQENGSMVLRRLNPTNLSNPFNSSQLRLSSNY